MKKCYLIGHPLGHSISPAMHNAAYKELGLDFEYLLKDTAPGELKAQIEKFKAENVAGFNVTIPYKEKIMPLLDEITPLAEKIGAVNTVKNENGKLIGYNTDGPGFLESLKDDAGFNPAGKKVVILGAGGAGRAIAVTLAEDNASSIIIYDPEEKKQDDLVEYLFDLFEIEIKKSADLQREINEADLLVNASPIGMHPNVRLSPIDFRLSPNLTIYDIIYNPPETELIKQAKRAGAKAVSGLGMLVRQGALAFEIFTGKPAPYQTMLSGAKIALHLKQDGHHKDPKPNN
ncbi:shikimate dehydrogenase [candidate division WOR-1 bacterium RIFOXYA12_FULL_43_27]|uniref:Shikimate dehydrogenase (NADP(+)) n=1 Tax=candidate division WOR-1 bacterium RIFOXYC2_FULL_46_14 TaxID=1802587 RepID=A0A1F4U6A7_UNCSA|nr:MAG: shikimate dehydrogenase [candidate division WOR-1 bacterium RIFOXYA12_FULL_43_27]OGC20576.1 MAG: shikimate dehydrogenase [candidate division WOR-1 bacterium RIFOXYB2_FULL_46_45]OGC31687.1 MAG: shikimate dehydrogenase [candidate division WOR-1 bacterium RIFOXYA2_FULL_46_56]OGC40417.1 MAG: shikimate dehydrogenase [candidate division WOR-1 bacterium RIFOXYC2_FULL_46_14]